MIKKPTQIGLLVRSGDISRTFQQYRCITEQVGDLAYRVRWPRLVMGAMCRMVNSAIARRIKDDPEGP